MSTLNQSNGIHIHCREKGSGPPIIFLHGWPTNSRLWDAQVEALHANYRTITLDWVGFGQSDMPLDYPYTFSQQKEALDTVLSKLLQEDEKVTIVAHDIGGPPAILWAHENQAKVERLILLNTVLYTLKTPFDAFSEILFSTPGIRNLLVSSFGLTNIMRMNTRSRGAALNHRIRTILLAHQTAPASLRWRTITEPMHRGRQHELLSLSNMYRQLAVPKALIIAKEDPLCYAHIRRLSEENPEVPVHHIPNCGHYLAIDRPEEVNAALISILSDGRG